MDKTLSMCGGQPTGRLQSDPQHIFHIQRSLSVESLLQRLARDEGHHEIGQFSVRGDGMNGHHVRIHYRGCGLSFPRESPAGGGT